MSPTAKKPAAKKPAAKKTSAAGKASEATRKAPPKPRRKPGEPRTVARDSGEARITGEGQRINVRWDCQTRSFTVQGLREVIEWIEKYCVGHGMWLNLVDEDGRGFWVTVRDKRMLATNEPSRDGRTVPWSIMKRELQAQIAENFQNPQT